MVLEAEGFQAGLLEPFLEPRVVPGVLWVLFNEGFPVQHVLVGIVPLLEKFCFSLSDLPFDPGIQPMLEEGDKRIVKGGKRASKLLPLAADAVWTFHISGAGFIVGIGTVGTDGRLELGVGFQIVLDCGL